MDRCHLSVQNRSLCSHMKRKIYNTVVWPIVRSAVPWLRLLVASFPPRRPGFDPRSGQVGFVVDNVSLGQVFSENFGFPCQFSFHRLLHTHYHLSSGTGTVGQTVADVPSGISITPPPLHETKNTINCFVRSWNFVCRPDGRTYIVNVVPNSVLQRIFVPRGEELHDKELHMLYSWPSIKMLKSRSTRWAGLAAHIVRRLLGKPGRRYNIKIYRREIVCDGRNWIPLS
jgi:hypothetical protein